MTRRINADANYQFWFERGELPSICMDLHMQHTGASDPWPETEVAECRRYLKARLLDWRASGPLTERFDLAVMELVNAVLAETHR